jgi:hypothetical protein
VLVLMLLRRWIGILRKNGGVEPAHEDHGEDQA